MRKIALLAMLLATPVFAGTKVTSTATGLIFADDGAVTRANLDSAVYATIAGVKTLLTNSQLVCAPTTVNLQPVLDAIKAQPACDLGPVLAAIKAIPGGGTVTPPPPPPPPPPPTGSSGVFIGTTEFASLGAAGGAYKPGDVIRITKSLDNDSTALVNGDVTVVCDPGVKLTWSAGYSKRIAWGKGFFAIEGTTQNVTIKGCTMDGAILDSGSGGNASCIRISDGLASATIDGVTCTNSDNGILGAAKVTTVTNSKFWNNGVTRKGYTHNVYFSAFADVVTVKNSYFGPVDTGNIFKSRAKTTVIDATTFEANTTRNSSYMIDISNGGTVKLTNSVLVKGPGQAQRFTLSFMPEGEAGDGRVHKFEAYNNIFVSDMNAAFINNQVFTPGALVFHDNVVAGSFDYTIPQVNSKVFASRQAAGLPAAPALPPLPAAVMSVMSVKKKK